MKLVKLKCGNCGADLEVSQGLKECFCTYCGNKLIIDDEIKRVEINKNINYKKSYVNEAEIKKQEYKMKKLEYKKKKEKRELIGTIVTIIIFIAFFVFSFFALSPKKDEVVLAADAKEYKGRNYEQVVEDLKSIGLENIETNAKGDVNVGIFVKDGEVESVTIDGNSKFEKGDYVKKDARVVVTYHSK